jgi:hypothetical protein
MELKKKLKFKIYIFINIIILIRPYMMDKFLIVSQKLVENLPKFENLDDIIKIEKFNRFLDKTISITQDIEIEQWILIDDNIKTDKQYK